MSTSKIMQRIKGKEFDGIEKAQLEKEYDILVKKMEQGIKKKLKLPEFVKFKI